VSQHAEVALTLAAVVGAPVNRATEPALVTGEGALDLPPLSEHATGAASLGLRAEPPGHLAAVFPVGGHIVAAGVNRDDGGSDAQLLAGEPVMGFGVEGRIGQHSVPGQAQGRQEQDRGELRGIVGRPGGDRGPGEEVGVRVGRDGELGPRASRVLALGAGDEVPRRVPAIQPGRIDGDGRLVRDQAALGRGYDGAAEEVEERPPFNSRPSA